MRLHFAKMLRARGYEWSASFGEKCIHIIYINIHAHTCAQIMPVLVPDVFSARSVEASLTAFRAAASLKSMRLHFAKMLRARGYEWSLIERHLVKSASTSSTSHTWLLADGQGLLAHGQGLLADGQGLLTGAVDKN